MNKAGKPLFDVRVINDNGIFITDCVTTKERAKERARFLIPRVMAVEVRNQKTWEKVVLL